MNHGMALEKKANKTNRLEALVMDEGTIMPGSTHFCFHRL